jgi:hypothetical protein
MPLRIIGGVKPLQFSLPEFLERDPKKLRLKTLINRLIKVNTPQSLQDANYILLEVPKLLLDEYAMPYNDVMNARVYDIEAKVDAISSRKKAQIKQLDGFAKQIEEIIKTNNARQDDANWDGVLTSKVGAERVN